MKKLQPWLLIGLGLLLSILAFKVIVHNIPGSEKFF